MKRAAARSEFPAALALLTPCWTAGKPGMEVGAGADNGEVLHQ